MRLLYSEVMALIKVGEVISKSDTLGNPVAHQNETAVAELFSDLSRLESCWKSCHMEIRA